MDSSPTDTRVWRTKMADDHYVAQTYLKNFAADNGSIVPYYKTGTVSVGKPKLPKSVCFKPDGNTNTYFSDPRILEEYLTPLENSWNDNLERLAQGAYDAKVKMEIASYLAFLRVCTPTAIRQSQDNLKGLLSSTAKVMAGQGLFHSDEFSREFNDRMVAMLMNDELTFTVQEEYAHAKNIEILNLLPITLCNADWKVLFTNGHNFLTSDNPFCLYYPGDNPMVAWCYVPLRPDMALLMRPKHEYSEIIRERRFDELPDGIIEYGRIKEKFLFLFNQNLVRHAEEKVFFREKADWVERMVKDNRDWQAVSQVDALPHPDGITNIVRHRVRKRSSSGKS